MTADPDLQATGLVYLVNGINASAAHTTDRLADWLERAGCLDVHRLTYPVTTWRTSRNRTKQYTDATRLMDQVDAVQARPEHAGKDRHLICHSHGCLLGERMMELAGTDAFSTVTLYAPAMDRVWTWPREAFDKMCIIHNKHDSAIGWAGVLPCWHPWGRMGKAGWLPSDPPGYDYRITQVSDTTKCKPRSHCHYFHGENLRRWGNWQLGMWSAWRKNRAA